MQSKKARRSILPCRGAVSMLFSGGLAPTSWRLDVREDSNDCGLFVSQARQKQWTSPAARKERRLGHYIAAGGMRAHRWSTADDRELRQRRLAIIIMLAPALVWLVFRFIPCACA